MKIRKAKIEEAIEISKLIRNTINRIDYNYSKSQIKAWIFINRLKEVRKWFCEREVFVVIKNYAIVGTASLRKNKISRFFIKHDFQGVGIGKKLILFLEKRAKSKGYNKIILEAVPSASGFYQRINYKLKRKKDSFYNKVKFQEIEMEKKI